MKKAFISISVLVLVFVFTGCGAPKNYTSIPNFKKEYKAKRNIIVVPPKVKMYEINAAGVEEMKEWSTEGTLNMGKSLSNIISKKVQLNYEILDLNKLTDEEKSSVLNTHNLMYRVSPSINLHALDRSFIKFDEKIDNFDYSVGDSLSQLSKDGDLFLFINASDRVQSSGKKAVETAKLIVGALFGIAAGDFGGSTYSTISLVDGKSGKILWHDYYYSKGQVDLREEKGTDAVVEVLLNDLQNNI